MKTLIFSWKRGLILGLLTIAGSHDGFAQSDSISSKAFTKKLNQTFGVIATGQSEAVNLANYGSFEPVNGAFKLNLFGPVGNVERTRSSFFSFSVSGNLIGESSTAIFSDSKLNNGVGLAGKFHIPFMSPDPIISGNQEQEVLGQLQTLKDKYRQKHRIDSLELDKASLQLRSTALENLLKRNRISIRQHVHVYDSLSLRLTADPAVADSMVSLGKQIQLMRNDSDNVYSNFTQVSALLASDFSRINKFNKVLYTDSLSYQKLRDSLENLISVKTKSFAWFSPVATIGRKKYYTFDDPAVYSQQLQKVVLTTYSIGVEFNYISLSERRYALISERSHHTTVFNLGAVYSRNNNIEDLTTTELSDARKYSAKDSSHSLTQKYSVYTDSVIEYKAFKLYANYYYYFGNTNNFALHVAPDIEFRNTKRNPLNLNLGFIIAYKNKKDNTIANIELYTKFLDLSNEVDLEEDRWIDRNVIGINFGIPLSILLTK